MSLNEVLNWRYATKSYNGKTVEQQKIDQILEAIRLAPTSSGLQPFKVLVITNKELREQLKLICADQQQIVDASHILVFAAWDEYAPERINSFFEFNNKVRNLPSSATDDYRLNLLDSFGQKSKEEQFLNSSRQSYIALGFGLLAAAELKVDATPMEGFDNTAVDELLKLPEQGYRSTVILALGYRNAENDWLVNMKKVRRSKEELFTEI